MRPTFSDIESVVRSVRPMLLPHHGKIAFTNKSEYGHDTLTQLDIDVEEFLRKELALLFPDVAFVGEETGGDRSARRMWLCDPIDGTSHFVRGTLFCTTMLAYIEDGIVQMGVIYDFINDRMYHAERGQGAFCDDAPITVSQRNLKASWISWETHLLKPENLETHLALTKQTSFFKLACAGYEFTMVASGMLDGRICFDPWGKDYDFAAGSLLVEEAGGRVANIGSTTYDYRNTDFLAVNPVLFDELTQGESAIFPIAR